MFPEEFLKRISSQKYIAPADLLKAMGEPSPVSIRINPAKWNQTPVNSEPVPWNTYGYYLKERPSYTLDPLFHSGCYYPQEASSMFLEQVISQTRDSSGLSMALDLCAAPGGKSLILSDLIGKESLLVANETIRNRSAILAETLTKWGTVNSIVTQNDPSSFGRLPGMFDIILVDAPCSGEGMFRTGVAVSEWSVSNTAHCSERQKRILMDVWPALREDGILVYSTCTFNPGENEENIRWLIGKQEAECIRIDISKFKGIVEIDYEGIYGYGFYPDKIRGEGFFMSAIRKKVFQEKIRVKSLKNTDLKPSKSDLAVTANNTFFPDDRILRWGEELIAVPCRMDDYSHLFRNLKIVKAGTKLFVTKKNDFLPAHELALSQSLKPGAFPSKELSLKDSIAFLKRDNFQIDIAASGWNLVTYKGVNLGFVKNLGNRINNYFPVEWRIRMDLPQEGKENILDWNTGQDF
jgi:16S rRNA C967 or C1407 C5-methylase (RsmB/RsmF family)/NOL1/NOP2/fmu family ribosome biogenesis protein